MKWHPQKYHTLAPTNGKKKKLTAHLKNKHFARLCVKTRILKSFSIFFKVQETYTISQRFVFSKFLHNAVYVKNSNIGYRPQLKTVAPISKLSCFGFHHWQTHTWQSMSYIYSPLRKHPRSNFASNQSSKACLPCVLDFSGALAREARLRSTMGK